ncbi:MAG: hypothetical protein ACPHIW_02815 [Ilumatobacteraceae bacterium]
MTGMDPATSTGGRGHPRSIDPPVAPGSSGGLREALLALAVLLLSLLAGGLGYAVGEELGLPEWISIGVLTVVGYVPPLVWSLRRMGRRLGQGLSAGRSVIGRPRLADVGIGALVWLSAVVAQAVLAAALLGLSGVIQPLLDGLIFEAAARERGA